MTRTLSIALCAAGLLAAASACSSSPGAQPAPATEARDPGPAPSPAPAACDATPLSWTVGQVADDALIEKARVQAGASTVRVLRPGMMITREFDGTRLNLRVDNERKVLAFNCG